MRSGLDYNEEPVYYCKHCLSLKVRNVPRIDASDYCDECGSTDIGQVHINEWENLYIKRHGIKYLNN